LDLGRLLFSPPEWLGWMGGSLLRNTQACEGKDGFRGDWLRFCSVLFCPLLLLRGIGASGGCVSGCEWETGRGGADEAGSTMNRIEQNVVDKPKIRTFLIVDVNVT
jgi:hypothetical protein